MANITPKWASIILDDPVKILMAAKCCIDGSGSKCHDCPFGAWADCYDILVEKIDMLIEKERK